MKWPFLNKTEPKQELLICERDSEDFNNCIKYLGLFAQKGIYQQDIKDSVAYLYGDKLFRLPSGRVGNILALALELGHITLSKILLECDNINVEAISYKQDGTEVMSALEYVVNLRDYYNCYPNSTLFDELVDKLINRNAELSSLADIKKLNMPGVCERNSQELIESLKYFRHYPKSSVGAPFTKDSFENIHSKDMFYLPSKRVGNILALALELRQYVVSTRLIKCFAIDVDNISYFRDGTGSISAMDYIKMYKNNYWTHDRIVEIDGLIDDLLIRRVDMAVRHK